MYYSKTDILKRLQEHNDYINKQVNGTIIGTFLYGSQNYHLNTPKSDVDSISIYIPTQEEIYFSKDWLSKEYEMANREHAVVKDIRVLMRDWLNGSMTNLEVLFTHFYVIKSDSMILDIFENIKKIVQAYLISNKEKMAKAIYGQILGTTKVKYLTPKKIKNTIRLYYALSIYQLADNKSVNHIFELDIIYRKEILRVYELLSHNNVNQVTYRAIADKYIKESEKVKNEILELSTNKDQINQLKRILQNKVQLLINHINN